MFTKVYSGRAGKCCCGCAGTYWRTGDKSFERMLRRVLNLKVQDEGNYVWAEVGERLYVAYRETA